MTIRFESFICDFISTFGSLSIKPLILLIVAIN